MSLRLRIGLTIVGLTFMAAVSFGALTYMAFVRQQDTQLHSLLQQDLDRVSGILTSPTLGTSFLESESGAFTLQLVTADERVVMSWGDAELLPLVDGAQVLQLGERSHLVGVTSWGSSGGTVRLAHDIEAPFQARVELFRNLLLNGTLVVIVATLVGLVVSRRHLGPLGSVAVQARVLDPGGPGNIQYSGPRDEIHDLVQALNTSLAAIRTRQDEEKAFLLEIAHELAAPLTLVRYHLETVQGEHPQDIRLGAAAAAAQELLRTSQDLLVLARGELERQIEPQVFFVSGLLERIQVEYPGLNVCVDTTSELLGDPERLMQVLRNLVRNGVQAAGDSGKVFVRTFEYEPFQVLEVADRGPGIRSEVLERIFEHRFSEQRGVGVGLSVARSLVEQHDGTIQVFSQPGEGTRFEVRLPSLASRLEPSATLQE